jgi:hypothetical protein
MDNFINCILFDGKISAFDLSPLFGSASKRTLGRLPLRIRHIFFIRGTGSAENCNIHICYNTR